MMDIWKKETRLFGGQIKKELNVDELIARLRVLEEQTDPEIIKLLLQSIVDELEDK